MTAASSDDAETPLSVTQTAHELGCSPATVKRLIKSRKLPATRLPSPKGRGHLRVERQDVKILKALSRI